MNRKGQGALEYLLLIGGAVLIAAIVITLIIGAAGPTSNVAEERAWDALCAQYSTGSPECIAADVDGDGTAGDCFYKTNNICRCTTVKCDSIY